MTGEIVDFGGRKSSISDDDQRALADAKACFATHDPFQGVVDFLDRTTNRIESSARTINAGSASTLNDDQVKALIYQTERAAERGVGMYAKRIASWHQTIVGAAFVAGLFIGFIGAWWWRPAADISGMTCQDDHGGRVCYMWVTPPQQGKAGR